MTAARGTSASRSDADVPSRTDPNEAAASRSIGVAPALAMAAAGGALYCLGYVGYGVWPLMLLFLAPLWWALDGVIGRSPLVSFAVGIVFGLSAYVGGFRWLWYLVEPFLGGNRALGAMLWSAYGLWFAIGYGVYAMLHRALRGRGWGVALAGIPSLVVVEWLQPQIFPLYAGAALVNAPVPWMQSADLGGPLLLTALIAAANVLALRTATWRAGMRRLVATWGAALLVAIAVLAYGRWRMADVAETNATAPMLQVGIVQANLSPRDKAVFSVVAHQRHLEQTRELLAAGTVDLVVWPETAYGRGLRRPLPVAGTPVVGDVAVPLLFGASSVHEESGRRTTTNSAFLVGPDGMIRDGYDKNLLIPLAEHLPLATVLPALREWLPQVEEFAASRETPPLRLGPWRIATPICYEAIRPEFVRRMMREARPHLLVTLANDAWFGDSQEPWIHLALARLRAVEQRRFLVRATNSGVSAIVDPAGAVVVQSGVLARDNLRSTVRLVETETVYARVGDWPGWLSAVVVVGALLITVRRR